MIGVVIPAHNEVAHIGLCLQSIRAAASHPALHGERVLVIVVADACTDFTESIAVSHGALVLSIDKRSVGSARNWGARLAVAHDARWLAFTDADTTVPADWLARQLDCATDAVCGVVTVSDWTAHCPETRAEFLAAYCDVEGHRHVHGANLGLSAAAYEAVGGFQPLSFNEDVALVDALSACNFSIAWTNKVRVDTSARTQPRAPRGFGATLRALAHPSPTQSPPISSPESAVGNFAAADEAQRIVALS